MDNGDETELREAVDRRLAALRKALRRYRRATGAQSGVLLDRRAEKLRPDALSDARVYADRQSMVAALAHGPVGAEIGVLRGGVSRFLLDTVAPEALHLFDLKAGRIRADVKADPRTHLHIGDSAERLAALTDVAFDWIYIDGDHTYAGCLRDAEAAKHRLKPGGVLFFNDYTVWSASEAVPYGVVPVVNDLVNAGYDLIGVALAPTGYHDVALRKPQSG